jgi:hypothetical protein
MRACSVAVPRFQNLVCRVGILGIWCACTVELVLSFLVSCVCHPSACHRHGAVTTSHCTLVLLSVSDCVGVQVGVVRIKAFSQQVPEGLVWRASASLYG